MRLILSLTIIWLVYVPAASAEIYKWTDDAGNVVFSDTPRPGAEVIELSEPTILPAQPTGPGSPSNAVARPVARAYETVEISRPENDSTIRNTDTVNVAITIRPRLQGAYGHRLQLLLDGQAVAPAGTRLSFTLSDVNRGAHTLEAVVVDEQGEAVERSASSQFFIHRASVARKQPR